MYSIELDAGNYGWIYILGGSTNRIKETLFPVCLGNKIYLSFSVFGDDKRVG